MGARTLVVTSWQFDFVDNDEDSAIKAPKQIPV
jgi:hypothetical protein